MITIMFFRNLIVIYVKNCSLILPTFLFVVDLTLLNMQQNIIALVDDDIDLVISSVIYKCDFVIPICLK